MIKILALDLGKYKTVACEYEAVTGRHNFATIPTTPKALHDLIVPRTGSSSDRDLLNRGIGLRPGAEPYCDELMR